MICSKNKMSSVHLTGKTWTAGTRWQRWTEGWKGRRTERNSNLSYTGFSTCGIFMNSFSCCFEMFYGNGRIEGVKKRNTECVHVSSFCLWLVCLFCLYFFHVFVYIKHSLHLVLDYINAKLKSMSHASNNTTDRALLTFLAQTHLKMAWNWFCWG